MNILFLFTGLIFGVILTYFFTKSKFNKVEGIPLEKYNELDKEKSKIETRLEFLLNENNKINADLKEERGKLNAANSDLATEKEAFKNMNAKLSSQKAEMEELQKKFTTEFENIANRLLEEKSKKFVEQNRTNLDIILNPLKDRIKDFEDKVDKAYKTEAAERNTLKGEIKNLIELNKQLDEEAKNLTKALKGDSKKQGNWGEMILEKILERSGLVKEQEYKMQVSTMNEEGKRIQPDAIIYLPENKHIIVDSKVSLVAYEALTNAATDEERERFIKEHILSVRNHIKSLSEKNYQTSSEFTTPDFVLLFIPIESSFGVAIQADNELFNYAWERKIVIVSPSTLLATLRTIASIWKQERQTKNALEIAKQSGALYDKFVGFVEDLIAVGKKMNDAKVNYEEAMNKLSRGPGNLVKKVEDIKKLGVKTNKTIPQTLLDRAEE